MTTKGRAARRTKRNAIVANWQGSLDGLCGVYAVINAFDLMFGRRFTSDLRAQLETS